MQNFRALGAPPPDPHWPPAAGGSDPRPPKQPPIANFWLRAWLRPQTPSLWQLGALPPNPIGLRRLRARPQTPKTAPHCEFLATRLSTN